MVGGRAISHVRCEAAWNAGSAMALSISRTKCAYLCEVRRKPGVWFFSLDASNSLAVAIARAWFHLPYFRARMSCAERGGWIQYQSERTHRGALAGSLKGRYRPVGETFFPRRGTLEYFLTERYLLYTADGSGHIIRGEIHHPPWPLRCAAAEFDLNTMANSLNLALELPSLLHFAKRQDVLVLRPERLA